MIYKGESRLNKIIEENRKKLLGLQLGHKITRTQYEVSHDGRTNSKIGIIDMVIQQNEGSAAEIEIRNSLENLNTADYNSVNFIKKITEDNKIKKIYIPEKMMAALENAISVRAVQLSSYNLDDEKLGFGFGFTEKLHNSLKEAFLRAVTTKKELEKFFDLMGYLSESAYLSITHNKEARVDFIIKIFKYTISEEISIQEFKQKIRQQNFVEQFGRAVVLGFCENFLDINFLINSDKNLIEGEYDEEELKEYLILLDENLRSDFNFAEKQLLRFHGKNKIPRLKIKTKTERDFVKLIVMVGAKKVLTSLSKNQKARSAMVKIISLEHTRDLVYQEVKTLLEIKINSFIKRQVIDIGKFLASGLYDEVLEIISQKYQLGLKTKQQNFVAFKDPEIVVDKTWNFPKMTNAVYPELAEMDLIGSYQDYKIVTRNTFKRISENYYIEASMSKKSEEEIKKIGEFTLFRINYLTTGDFILDLAFLSKFHNNESELGYSLLQELYGIDFKNLTANMEDERKKFLIQYATNFETITRPPKQLLKYQENNFEKMLNGIYSRKLEITSWLCQIEVNRYKCYFKYNIFLDPRGRFYPHPTNFSYQGNKIIRSFISFHNADQRHSECYRSLRPEIIQRNNEVLFNQLKSFLTVKTMLPYDLVNSNPETLFLEGKIKLGEYYNFRTQHKDLVNAMTNFEKFSFIGTVSFDSSSSGIQHTAMFLRSKALAKLCHLVLNEITDFDLYYSCIKFLLDFHKFFKEIWSILSTKTVLQEFFKIYQNYDYNADYQKLGLNKEKITDAKKIILNNVKYERLTEDFTTDDKILILKFLKFLGKSPKNKFPESYDYKGKFSQDLIEATEILCDLAVIFDAEGSWIHDFVDDRKLAKTPILSIPYGLTLSGIENQILEFFDNKLKKKGMLITNLQHANIHKYANIIKYLIKEWADTHILDAFILLNFIQDSKEISTEKLFFENEFVSFEIMALKSESFNIPAGKHSVTNNRYNRMEFSLPINKKDTKKIRSSTTANIIHSLDAMLARYIDRIIRQDLTDSFYSVHDRFYIDPEKGYLLKQYIAKGYTWELDSKIFENYMEKFKFKVSWKQDLTSEDLNDSDFVKH